MIAAGTLALLLPAVWPADPEAASFVRGWLGFVVLLAEVFAFHGGVFLLALGAVALVFMRRVSACALLVLGAGLSGPGVLAAVGNRAEPSDAPGVTVLSSNLLFMTANLDLLSADVESESPDVIVLQEVFPRRGDELRARFAEEYPHTVGPTAGRWGTMILSRLPIRVVEPIPGIEPWGIGQAAGLVSVDDGDDRRDVLVVATHLPSPTRAGYFVAGEQMAGAVADWIGRVRTEPGAPDAVILAGDFNAPLWSTRLSPLRHAGLIEANAVAGAGRGSTWPAKTPLRFIPGIRLDQAAAVGAGHWAESRVLGPIGSDHRPIVVRYVFDG